MAYKRKRDPIPEEIEYNEKLKEDIRKGIYRFVSPEEADRLITAKIKSFTRFGGKTVGATWNEGELQLRHSVILEYICHQGLSRAEVVKQISDRWEISEKTASSYVNQAIDSLTRDYDEYTEETRKVHMERLESLLQRAIENERDDQALKILDQMAKITNLYEQKINLNANNNTTLTFDFS
ncbi:MAG: hypothetical protein J6Y78_03205 [Paludibacteraceae bacterium]|nr:hypothetical protein [Paludibacteraceae bacterium]